MGAHKHHVRETKSARVIRFLKRTAVAFGFVFVAGLAGLVWAFKTGRAVDAVQMEVIEELRTVCKLDAAFGSLSVGVFPPELHLSELELKHFDGRRLLSVEEAIVSLKLLPLLYGRLQLARVAVLGPEASIELEAGKILNLPVCVEPSSAPLAKEGPTRLPIALGVNELTIERGRFELVGQDEVQAELKNIAVSLVPASTGGLNIAVGLDDGSLTMEDETFVVSRVRMLGHLEGLISRPRALSVDLFEVHVADAELSGKGSVDLLGPVYDGELKVEAPLNIIHRLVDDIPKLHGNARVEVSVAGTVASPRASGSVFVEKGQMGPYRFGDASLVRFIVDRKKLELPRVDVTLDRGRVLGSATLDFDQKRSFRMKTEVENLSFGRLMDALGLPGTWIDWRATGRGDVRGGLTPLSLAGKFDYDIRRLFVYDQAWDSPRLRATASLPSPHVLLHVKPARVAGAWRWDEEGVSFSKTTIQGGDTKADAAARVYFEASRGMWVDAHFSEIDFRDIGPIAGLKLEGIGALYGRLEANAVGIGAKGRFDLASIRIGGIPFGQASSEVRWHDEAFLDFSDVRGRLKETAYQGDVSVHVAGEVPIDVQGSISRGRVQDVLIPLGVDGANWGDPRGKIEGDFHLKGPVSHLSGPIGLRLKAFEILGERAEKAMLKGRLDEGVVVLDKVRAHKHGGTVVGRGRFDPHTHRVRAQVDTKDFRLKHIDLLHQNQERLDGELMLHVGVQGQLGSVTGTVAARVRGAHAGSVPLADGSFRGRVQGGAVEVEGGLSDGTLSVASKIALRRHLPYEAKVLLKQMPVAQIVSGLQGHLRYKGNVSLEARLGGSLVDWHLSSGKMKLKQAVLATQSYGFESAGSTKFLLKRGVFQTGRWVVTGPRTRLVAKGRFGKDALDLKLSGRVDLGVLEGLSPSVERAGGSLLIDAGVGGTFMRPDLVGTGRVDGAILQWRGIPSRLSGFQADLSFSQSTVVVDRSLGRWAGGRLEAEGRVFLRSFQPDRVDLSVRLKNTRPTFALAMVDLSGQLDGDLALEGSLAKLLVRGDLRVRRPRARPKLEWQSLTNRRLTIKSYDPSRERLTFDVGLKMQDPLRMKNDSADVELLGHVRLSGTNERVGLLGTLVARQGGRVTFFAREYELDAATIEFTDRFRFWPQYDLLLNSRACDARIRANVVGTLDRDPQISLTSVPEMDEDDIASCLISGVRKNIDAETFAPLASNMLWKASGVDRQVRKVLPVDQIDVSTEYSSQTQAYEPRVLIAKEILDGRIRLEYSSSLVKTTDQRAALTWRLTPRLTLEAGWTSSEDVPTGDLGLDLKRRWEW